MRREQLIAALERDFERTFRASRVTAPTQLPSLPPSPKSKAKRSSNKSVSPFTPEVIFTEPVILRDDDLQWTTRFRSGVFCFHQGRLGISFKNAHAGLIWEIGRQYCGADLKVDKRVRDITCFNPVVPGTFVPIKAPREQTEIMRCLLKAADIVEKLLVAEANRQDDSECDYLRSQLNDFYDDFVSKFGLLANCKSYYDGIWNDVRLEIYLSQLTDEAGNKSDIFKKRLNYPPREVQGQQFYQEDLDVRLTSAFSWCMGWYGQVQMPLIAEAAGVDEDRAIDILRRLGLVYRQWLGYKSSSWWDLLGVDEKVDSLFELKEAHRAKVKEWHPDLNDSPKALKMTQMINEAYEKALSIVSDRSPRVKLVNREVEVKVHGKDNVFIEGMAAKLLAVCLVPKENRGSDTTKQYVLIDIVECQSLALFSSQANALSCLRELEAKYPNAWHKGHDLRERCWQVIRFYQ